MKIRSFVFLVLALSAPLAAWGCQREGERTATAQPLQVTLATTPVVYTGLIAIAEREGFFKQNGLEATIRSDYPSGLASMQALERGEAQMATGAEFVFTGMMETDPSLRILASIGSTSDHEIVLLAKRGHQVKTADNGRIALEMLRREPYDVVFMDMRMSEMDGFEAVKRIRSGELRGIDPNIPIVALTAHALAADKTRCLASGMDDYIPKPIEAGELDRVLERFGAK